MPLDLSGIGQALQTAREKKNLSLTDVSEALFIRKKVIGAIEAGKWEELPHEVYVKGYLTQYASFLGILDDIQGQLTAKENWIDVKPPVAPTPRVEPTVSRWQAGKRIAGLTVLVLIVGGFFVFQNVRKPVYVAPAPPPHPVEAPRQPAATPYQPAETALQPVSAPVPEAQEDKIVLEAKKLMIACQQRTWVRIVIDGSEKKEFILNPEEVVVLNGKESFDLLIGNAGGVKLFYNGKDTGFTGGEGEVKRINLS